MRDNNEKPRNIVNRFLSDLGEPVPSDQVDRATADVRERLEQGDWRASAPVAVLAPVSNTEPAWSWRTVAAALALMLAGGLLHTMLLPRADTDIVANAVRGDLRFEQGGGGTFAKPKCIEAGRVLRAGSGGGTIALHDGSEVELGPMAE